MLQLSDFHRIGWTPEELDDQIYLVRDVLTSDECQEIVTELERHTQEQWSESYVTGMREYSLRQFGRPMEELIKEGVLSVDPAWVDKNLHIKPTDAMCRLNQDVNILVQPYEDLLFRGVGSVQRQYTGSELKLHTDGDSEPAVVYAVICYVNDNYTDGELYFPTRSLEVRPPAGSVIFFPTTHEYKHGVHPVGPGPTRYVLPSFIQTTKESSDAI